MLFVLTGQVQTGKTRWLEELVHDLSNAGVTVFGVLAPGVWADRRNDPAAFPHADANGFEKLGIDNVLLPSRERIAFARRADLAQADGTYVAQSQSGKAKLGWHIDDAAIERVNAHFAELKSCDHANGKGILVIDELGRLELERGEGLTEALAVLEAGSTGTFQHALVVVREALLPHLEGKFDRWGQIAFVNSDEPSRMRIMAELNESG